MNTPTPANGGKLDVDIDSRSVFFGYNVPVEIRNSRMQLVERSSQARHFSLQPGFYRVSAVLEDGREHATLVEVTEGETTSAHLGIAKEPSSVAKPAAAPKPSRSFKAQPRFTQSVESLPEVAAADWSAGVDAELVSLSGATIVRETPGAWIVASADHIDGVPTATVRLGKRTTTISLPTSPEGSDRTCALRVDPGPDGMSVSAWITPERIVANAFMNMMASRELPQAARMADQATEMLRAKYSDPTGAALGAVILHKVGRLERLESWVRNLARDFAWMPDGKILLASLIIGQRSSMDEARNLLVEASRQRVLFTDSFSILLDLLRRWPEERDDRWRRDALKSLSDSSPYADWDSICFSETRRS